MKLDKRLAEIGRLALREEGDSWNAYWALPDSMEGAIFLASVRIAFVKKFPARYDQFLVFVRECVADLLEETLGKRPDFNRPRRAPEHERSGSA